MQSKCKVIAVANQKGGVGKTTTTEHLGIGLAKAGKKVLLIDLDPQANLTACLGWQNVDALDHTVSDVIESSIRILCGIIFPRRCTMNGKYQPGQKVFLTGGNKNLIKEATVLKYTGGFYTIRFNNGGGVKVRESRIYPSREEAEAAILNRKR